MSQTAINLQHKFAQFTERWSPRVVAEMNDYQFKLVRIEGEFVWHSHLETDEVFIVIEGQMSIEFRDGRVELGPGKCKWFAGASGTSRSLGANAKSC
jgi:mannose-6-phosphate isomerase-like protein (cupin superfamily)